MSIENDIAFEEFNTKIVKALLFDIDGTLSDTDDLMVERVVRKLKPFLWMFRNNDPHHFARWLVMGAETPANFIYGLADKLGFDQPISNLYNWLSQKRRQRNPKRDKYRIIPGVKEMLSQFDRRFLMAVVSARDALTTENFLKHFDLEQYFNVVVTAQTCEHTKPFPDPVIFAAEQLGIDPEACLMIGDTIVDIYAGQSAGAQTVAVLCGFGSYRELQRAGADLILETTSELVEVLCDA